MVNFKEYETIEQQLEKAEETLLKEIPLDVPNYEEDNLNAPVIHVI